MPIYNIDIEKFYNGDYYSNRYQVLEDTIGAARTTAQDIVDAERAVHSPVVLFTKVRTSDGDPDTDSYFSDPINLFGLVEGDAEYLPSFNRIRVDFQTADGGRPCRKYLLTPIKEASQSGGSLNGSIVSFMQTNYVEAMLAIGTYCDPQGSPIVGGSVFPRVAMRQLRRASKRTTPVLP